MRIAVCLPQVPFAWGGAEILASQLADELRLRGHETALVSVPFKWYPGTRVLTQAYLWRLLDLEEANGSAIDLVIATKFPSYAVRHPRKVVWLVHQFRQAYELDRTELGQFDESAVDRATRRSIHELDRRTLAEAARRFAISQNVADRLARSTGLDAEVLVPPPQRLPYRECPGGGFVLSVGRLDRAKRVELLLEAAAAQPHLEVVVAGEGPDRDRLVDIASDLQLGSRVRFVGRVEAQELADLYSTCAALFYGPIDEDLGMAPYEAFLAGKPVVTTNDAGGVLEAVSDGVTGVVAEPSAAAVAAACARLVAEPATAAALGTAGRALAERLTWDRVVDRLLGA